MSGIDTFVSELRSIFVVLVVAAKLISAVFSLALIGGIIWLLRNSSFLEDRRQMNSFYLPPQSRSDSSTAAPETKSATTKRWEEIRNRLTTEDEGHYQLAIIEADKLVDNVLKDRGYEGSSMGERLKQLDQETFPRLEQLWYVHKVRNEIVHSSEYHIALSDAEEILNTYERVLRDLDVL